MEELADGEVEPIYADLYPRPRAIPTIAFDPSEVERVLGIKVPIEKIVRVLESLACSVQVPSSLPKGAQELDPPAEEAKATA